MRGSSEVKDLRELEPGKLHEITLVLSWCPLKAVEEGRQTGGKALKSACMRSERIS